MNSYHMPADSHRHLGPRTVHVGRCDTTAMRIIVQLKILTGPYLRREKHVTSWHTPTLHDPIV